VNLGRMLAGVLRHGGNLLLRCRARLLAHAKEEPARVARMLVVPALVISLCLCLCLPAAVVGSDVYGWKIVAISAPGTLSDVWGSSATDVFAVGVAGTVLHFDGSSWTPMSSGLSFNHSELRGVWGSSATDVFAVGEAGIILHYNGSNWSAMSSGTTASLNGVWGSSATDVFAVGDNTTILHYEGSSWTAMSSGTTASLDLNGVWGSSATDVLAVGGYWDTGSSIYRGIILHYDGSVWGLLNSGTTSSLWDVWGSSPTDIFAVGMGGTILHYNGSNWSALSSGTTAFFMGVWGSSATDVFAVGCGGSTIYHYDGSSWTPMSSGWTSRFGDNTDCLRNVWGSSATNVFVVCADGAVLGYPVLIAYQPPNQPSQDSPTNGATGMSLTPTLRSLAFSDPDVGDTHVASQWQVATSANFSDIVFDSGSDTSHLTSIPVPASRLGYSTTYYWHVRYEDNHGDWSTWSAETAFTTTSAPPNQPANVSPADGAADQSPTPTLQSSTFSGPDNGDVHAASQWQITTATGDYSDPVFDSGPDTKSLTEITVPSNTLRYSTTYHWRVRHQDGAGNWSEWSSEASFTTRIRPFNFAPVWAGGSILGLGIIFSAVFYTRRRRLQQERVKAAEAEAEKAYEAEKARRVEAIEREKDKIAEMIDEATRQDKKDDR